MRTLAGNKTFFLMILLCTTVFPALAALLLCCSSLTALPLLLASSLCTAAGVLGLCWRYLRTQDRQLEDAALQIADYILDQRKGGIECDREGALYHLFHEVNSLVAIADAHAGSERRTKEFLRNTISDISHQLKTPITALNIYNGILQQEAEDAASVQEFVSLSEQELDRMESLVRNLLKMAQLDAGALPLEQSPENIAELLEQIKEQYSFRAGQEEKEISLEGDEQAVLVCDRTWLTEAIGNLIKNALDHTEPGEYIRVRWQQSPYLTQITVEDTGSGIPPEDLYHIFKRFYRSRFSKDTQGVGLGLPLAKSIIEAHQGSIEVRSELRRGTTFTINFPIMTK